MQEYTYHVTEKVLLQVKVKVISGGAAQDNVDCIITERTLVVGIEPELRIPLNHIRDYDYGYSSPGMSEGMIQQVRQGMASEPGIELQYPRIVKLKYIDDSSVLQTLTLEIPQDDSARFSQVLESAVGRAKTLDWNALPVEQRVAGFWRRLAAYVIDGIIISIIGGILNVIAHDVYVGGLGYVIQIGYFIGFWTWRGQTPGKMLLGVKIVTRDEGRISLGRAILRYIGYIVSTIILFIGFFMIAWDKRKQGLHDKIAGTYVIKLA